MAEAVPHGWGRRGEHMVKRICDILTTLVLVIAVALIVAFAGVRAVGLTPYAVLSGSMEPELPVGSLIYVKGVDPSTISAGDTITFSLESGTLVTHQVYEVDAEAGEFRTQGIANVDSEGNISRDASPVPFERVVGVPVLCIPWLGYINAFLTGPGGVFALVAVIGGLIILQIVASLASGRGGAADGADSRPIGSHARR